MRPARSRRRSWQALSGALVLAILSERATSGGRGLAQTLNFLDGGTPEGSRIEYTNPTGFSCRFTEGARPSLQIGAGLAGTPILPGATLAGSEFQDALVLPSRLGAPEPVLGIALRIPLGTGRHSSCDRLIEMDRRKAALDIAKELFEQGLITKKQLEAVAAPLYQELLK